MEEKKENEVKKSEEKVLDKREAQRKRSKDPLPERKKYEMLCRGEGVKLVRRKMTFSLDFLSLSFIFFSSLKLLFLTPLDAPQTESPLLPLL